MWGLDEFHLCLRKIAEMLLRIIFEEPGERSEVNVLRVSRELIGGELLLSPVSVSSRYSHAKHLLSESHAPATAIERLGKLGRLGILVLVPRPHK